MANYLVFRLYSPMASWGEPASGEYRNSATVPTASALIGLIAAALGIKRSDSKRLSELTNGFHYGIKRLSAGSSLFDYHTAQTVQIAKGYKPRTRRQELLSGHLQTILSRREYRCDSEYVIAIGEEALLPFTADEVKGALEKPQFHLYAGRKSCVLGAPLAPRLVNVNTLKEALDTLFSFIGECDEVQYFWNGSQTAIGEELQGCSSTISCDIPVDRQEWLFTRQRVYSGFPIKQEGEQ